MDDVRSERTENASTHGRLLRHYVLGMSIDFMILCTRSPTAFLATRASKRLSWDPAKLSGRFGSMGLRQEEWKHEDPLPDSSWAHSVVAVIHAEGHLSDSLFDRFDAWMHALAETTHGAIYSPMAGKFIYVWPGVEREPTVARASALLEAKDHAGLARWVAELSAAHAPKLRSPCPAWCQIGWIKEAAVRPLKRAVAMGDASSATLIVALHHAYTNARCFDLDDLDALVQAAAKLPSLSADRGLQELAAQRKTP